MGKCARACVDAETTGLESCIDDVNDWETPESERNSSQR